MNRQRVMDSWGIAEADYPENRDQAEKLRFLLRYAVLAPSGHNTQPWLFRIGDGAVEIHADRSRALPVVDPHDRELTISCGAALGTLRIAMRHFGLRHAVELLPDPEQADLLARVTLQKGDPADGPGGRVFDAICRRRSNRQAFQDREVPRELTQRLVADAGAEGVWLRPVEGDDRAAVAELVARGDRLQMADKDFRRELAAWIHPNSSRSDDGMRGYGFGLGEVMSQLGPFVIRSFDAGKGQAAKDRELAAGAPLLAVLGSEDDDPRSWLRTGQALQGVLLRARAGDVWSSYLNQPIEVEDLRPRLAKLIDREGEFPQLLLRFGFGPEVAPEPRRSVDEVIAEPQLQRGPGR